ncbi:MAG: NAD(P)H-dependent oxidoreductase [Ethanoligenens sp.]|uniref:NAD(P)H-dependent oxidoreductase n=1 Tax=Ethanoligenens sp. TaxID=2099655 RepID=UPI0039E8CA23
MKNIEEIKQKVLDAYAFRHACKEFDPAKKVSDADFSYILETGRLSPSSFGLEPWKFLIIQDQAFREKLMPAAWGAQKKLETASHFVVILARKAKDLRYDSPYFHDFIRNVKKLPDDVAQGMTNAVEGFQKNDFKLLESDRAMFDWACKQTYIALGNMMTAAALIGIDSCPMEGFDRAKVEEIMTGAKLYKPEEFGVACMVAFGYRAAAPAFPQTRQSAAQVEERV